MSGDPDLYLQALSLQVSPDDEPTVARQGLRLQGEQHLAQELVLPLPVHVVHREPQHPLGDTLAGHLRETRAQLGSGVESGDGMAWYVLDTGSFHEGCVNQGPVHPKPRHPQGTLCCRWASIPGRWQGVPEPCHAECAPRTSSTHHPLDLKSAGP